MTFVAVAVAVPAVPVGLTESFLMLLTVLAAVLLVIQWEPQYRRRMLIVLPIALVITCVALSAHRIVPVDICAIVEPWSIEWVLYGCWW